MNILITGGAGYIGSHTCVELLTAGHEVVVLDNFSNSKPMVFDRVELICGRRPIVYEGDVCDEKLTVEVLAAHNINSVVHFAGLKAVGESVEKPLQYYANNIAGSLSLFSAMQKNDVRSLVFSSSATVYGNPHTVPIVENFPLSATNPYGRTKLMIEEILQDLYISDNSWHIAILRYFNPVGAHESGLIGEDPNGVPNNLMPYISQVAIGRRENLQVYGNDYPTHDGTGVRDFIHVVDLSLGHVAALSWLQNQSGIHTFNLGTGKGSSVLDVVNAYENASGKNVPYRIVERRAGDIAECYADATFAEQKLGWKAKLSIEKMCSDSWNWQTKNPNGYE